MARNPLSTARTPHLLALEPRVMFDGAAPATFRDGLARQAQARAFDHAPAFARAEVRDRAGVTEAHPFPGDAGAGAHRSDTSEPLTPQTEIPPSVALPAAASGQIIFIDTSVADYQQLARDWSAQGQVVLIDKGQDGLAQIEAALAGRIDLSAIHIVSHGEEGALLLGTTRLDEAAITGAMSQELAAIGRSLAPGGDILVYGCDFAEGSDGARALDSLAMATGADVAASTDLTGDAALGGDWNLEAHHGAIQARTLSDTAWEHELTPGPVNAVPISVPADSLTVTDANGTVVASGASMGFTNGYSQGVGKDATARWTGVATQNGVTYDLVATVVSVSTNDYVQFLHPTGQTQNNKTGDDATFLLTDNSGTNNSTGDGASVQINWQLVVTNTNTPAPADVTFNVLDIDGVGNKPNSRESVTAKTSELYYYTHESVSDVIFDYDAVNDKLTASGTKDENPNYPNDPTIGTQSEASFSYKKTSGFNLTYTLAPMNGAARQARFFQDGDSDFAYTTPVYGSIPHLNLDPDGSTHPDMPTDAHFTFTANGAAVPVVDSDVLVTNPEAERSITSATVTLTNPMTDDMLNVGTLPNGIMASTSTANGKITVTLNGAGSETDYQAALQAITFQNTSATPDTTQRVLTVAFTNDVGYAASATSRIDVADPPVNTLPASYTIAEDMPLQLTGIAVADMDPRAGALTITLSVPTGTLTAASAGNVTVTGSGGSFVTLTGTQADLDTYLASANAPTFTGARDANGAVTLTMVTSDNGSTGAGGAQTDTDTSTITVTPVNDPPVNNLPSSYSVAEDTPLSLSGISVSDVDAGSGTETITLSAPDGEGTLAAASGGGVVVSGSGTRSLTLDGTLADLNTYLGGASTRPTFTGAQETSGPVTLTMVTNDKGNTGDGGAQTATATSTITVTPVNDPPVNSLPAGYTTVEDGGPLSLSGISVSDVDAGSGVETITFSVPDGSGVLAAASAGGVTASGSGGTSVTLSGTLAALNSYLGSASTRPSFTSAPDFNGAVTLTMVTDDGAATGAGGAQRDTDSSTITVTAVNDPPVNTVPASYAGAEETPLSLRGISVSDVDAGAGLETITLSVPAGSGSLAATDAGGVTASGSGGNAITLSGTLSDLNAYLGDASTRPVFTGAQGRTDPVTLTVTTNDKGNTGSGGAQSDTDTSIITLRAVNHPPAATGTLPTRAAQDAQTVSYPTAGGFSDPDGDTLSYSATGLPAGLSINAATGVISGTLDRSASQPNGGAYTVTVRATDPSGASATQGFNLAVSNPAPDAHDDAASTRLGTPVTIAVLANDGDPDGDPLTVTGAGGAGHGAVQVGPNGAVTYTPDAGFSGTDAFTYTISDGQGGTSSATVTVTVAPDGAPVARPDQATTSPGGPVKIPVLANDSDPDGDPLTVTGASAPNGALALNSDGTITYTPNAGFTGMDVITYSVSDGRGGAASATVIVTVQPAPNGAPRARPDQADTSAGAPVKVAVLANDTDPDGDPLTVSGAGPAAHGVVLVDPDGTLTYTPDAGFTGVDSFAYTVSDGRGGSATATVAVTVGGAADGVPTARPDQATTSPGMPVTVAVLANDTDPDGDPLTVTGAGAPGHGAVAINGDGALTYTPDAGFTGSDSFTYTVSDGRGGVAMSVVNVTVGAPTDAPPVARRDQAATSPDTPVTVAVLANDSDPDGDPLSVTGASALHGVVGINPDGTVTYTPDAGFTGVDTLTYTISDGRGGAAASNVAVSVGGAPNASPVARPDQAGTLQDRPVTVAVLANDTDADGDPLTLTGAGASHGVVALNPDGTLTYTPDAGFTGIDTITYSVADGRGGTATSTVSMTVDGVPTARPDQASTASGAPVKIAVLDNDSDPEGDPLSVTRADAANGAVTLNPDGTLTYTPDAGFAGVDTLTYAISDGRGGAATSTVAVTVEGPPVARPDVASTSPGAPATIDVLANDSGPTGAHLAVTSATAAHGAVVINPDGTLTYSPNPGFRGADVIAYAVSADGGAPATTTATVAVGRPTADVDTLLAIGRVIFPDPGGARAVEGPPPADHGVEALGAGRVPALRPRRVEDALSTDPGAGALAAGGQDGAGHRSPAGPGLAVHDAVIGARTLNDTNISLHPVGGAVDAVRRLDGTSIDRDAPVAGEVRRLDDDADFRDTGDRAFDPRWSDFAPKPLTGFSRRAEGDEAVMFDSVVRGGAIYLDVQDIATDGRAPIRDFAVAPTFGGALPGWIRVDPRGLAIIERPADVDELHLVLQVTRQDGRVVRTPVVIQGATGEIELNRQPQAPPPSRGHDHHAQAGERHTRLDHTLSTVKA